MLSARFTPGLPAPASRAEGHGAVRRIEVHVDRSPEEMVVRIRGEATAVAAQAVEAGLLLPAALREPLVTLDLSELGSLSYLVMRALVAFYRGVVRRGGRVRLRPVFRPEVGEALERTGLLDLFEPFEATESSGAAEPSPAQAATE